MNEFTAVDEKMNWLLDDGDDDDDDQERDDDDDDGQTYLWSMVMYCLISLAISTAWSVWILRKHYEDADVLDMDEQ